MGHAGNRRGAPVRTCRVCGCTEESPCITGEGPCYWVGPDLCSACAGAETEPGSGLRLLGTGATRDAGRLERAVESLSRLGAFRAGGEIVFRGARAGYTAELRRDGLVLCRVGGRDFLAAIEKLVELEAQRKGVSDGLFGERGAGP